MESPCHRLLGLLAASCMADIAENSVKLPRYAFGASLGLVFFTWMLLLVGGIVHGTGSSLACPDWPTCYGTFFPKMTGGIFYEHGHRLWASGVGLWTLVMTVGVWRRGDKTLCRWGWIALFLVIFQGLLGGLTVNYRLPPMVSVAHLGTSMIFFAVLVFLSVHSWFLSGGPMPQAVSGFSLSLLRLVLIAVFAQILLGGAVRHLGAGLACIDLPLCQGALWPQGHWLLKIHMAHRLWAVAVALLIFLLAYTLLRQGRGHRFERRIAVFLVLSVLLQMTLGWFSVDSALGLFYVTAHLGVGALLWGGLVLLFCTSLHGRETSDKTTSASLKKSPTPF